MNDLSHPADPGFRAIVALFKAKTIHRRVAGCLPDWPPSLKDAHDAEWLELSDAWMAMWDVFCAEDAPTATVPSGVPCAADVVWDEAELPASQDTVSREVPTLHEIPCSETATNVGTSADMPTDGTNQGSADANQGNARHLYPISDDGTHCEHQCVIPDVELRDEPPSRPA